MSPDPDNGQDHACNFSRATHKPIDDSAPVSSDQEPSGHPPIQHGAPTDPFIIEICAGTARVTSCLQALGLKASFGVDHKRIKNAGRVLVADLTAPEGQKLCLEWIQSPSCAGIFCAPPCGTCSRARGIPITLPNGYKVAGPQPLRTDDMPDGVPHMSYLNRCRVKSANTLYQFITTLVHFCLAH